MSKRITIKDIASEAGISLGAAHYALSGQPGVSEETRARVLAIAKKHNYHANRAAASLKRKTIKIAVVFPSIVGVNRFYLSYYWEGQRAYFNSIRDFNIQIIEKSFTLGEGNHSEIWTELEKHDVQGLLCATGYMNEQDKEMIRQLAQDGLAIALVGEDLPDSEVLCCVQPNYDVIGRTVAELLSRQMKEKRDVVVCAGQKNIPSHYEIVEGMTAYFSEHSSGSLVCCYEQDMGTDGLQKELKEVLDQVSALGGCFSVTARGSVALARALRSIKQREEIYAVGSDMFMENVLLLQEGIFTNLINKNPYAQANKAARMLAEYLIRGTMPEKRVFYIGSEVVFQSSLPLYEEGSGSNIFL